MRKSVFAKVAMAIGLFAAALPICAHHSQAVYDEDHLVTIKGVVTKFEWVNPHILIRLEVKDEKGNVEEWVAFSGSPSMQSREAGWTPEEFKSGEELTISGFPQKDGRRIMLGAKHIRANGEEIPESIAEQRIYQGYMDRRRKEAGKQ
jgi:uncharacterized protein DUF6152